MTPDLILLCVEHEGEVTMYFDINRTAMDLIASAPIDCSERNGDEDPCRWLLTWSFR